MTATLRDGEQTPGVVLRREDKLAIARLLDSIGVDRIEAGMPAVSDEDYAAIADIVQSAPRAKIFAFARAMPTDIDLCARSGVKAVVVEVPSGYLRLYQYRWTEDEVIKRSLDAVAHAKPEQADRWTWLVVAAYTELRLARGLVADCRLPWEPPRDPHRLTPTRVRRGFRRLVQILGTPARAPKPTKAGPGRPKGSRCGPAPRYPAIKKAA